MTEPASLFGKLLLAKKGPRESGATRPSAPKEPPIDARSDGTPNQTDQRSVLEGRRATFKKARAAWVAVKAKAESDLERVKDGARMQYLADAEQFPKIENGCKAIDAILDRLDDELRDTLDQYASTSLADTAKLQALAISASSVLDRYIRYVDSDPLLKAVDHKEFADVLVHAPIVKALTTLRRALA